MLQTHEEEFSFNKGSNACLQIIMIIKQIDFVSWISAILDGRGLIFSEILSLLLLVLSDSFSFGQNIIF